MKHAQPTWTLTYDYTTIVLLDDNGDYYAAWYEFKLSYSDSDSNGVADPDDRCPAEPGPPTNSGCPFTPPAVGGIVELSADVPAPGSAGSNSPARDYAVPIAAVVAAGAAAIAAAGWYARRRLS